MNTFADNDFKFKEICRKFSKWLENTVGKGEIAHYEQFLIFLQCFQKTCTADTIGQSFWFANWVQNKDSLSMLCTAQGAFISRNTVFIFSCNIEEVRQLCLFQSFTWFVLHDYFLLSALSGSFLDDWQWDERISICRSCLKFSCTPISIQDCFQLCSIKFYTPTVIFF